MSSDLINAEQTLQACQTSLSALQAMQQYNQSAADYNNNINTQYAANMTAWTQQKQQIDNQNNEATGNYENCKNTSYLLYSSQSEVWNNCTAWTNVNGHDDWCETDMYGKGLGSGWHQIGAGGYGCLGGWGRGVCGRTDDGINRLVNNACPSPNYQQYPQQPQSGALKEQNTTPVQINCCANISTIIGSNVTNTSIGQANDCVNQLASKVDTLKNQSSTTTQPPQSSTKQSSSILSDLYNYQRYNIIIIVRQTISMVIWYLE